MIGKLSGIVDSIAEDHCILDVNGVRLVVSTVADRDASPANLAKLQAIVDSVHVERIVAAPATSPAP